MTQYERVDEAITSWLQETAPSRLPERVLDATFERTRGTRQQVGWHSLRGIRVRRALPALSATAVVVLVAVVGLKWYAERGIGGEVSPFVGSWEATDDPPDSSHMTMEIVAASDGAYDITIRDDYASVCGGTSSTMTGVGEARQPNTLVIEQPVYRCDDGSEPQALSGPPLQDVLRNQTFVHDAKRDLLDNGGLVWSRLGAPLAPVASPKSGSMWPQTTLDEVRQAQAGADAGDPAYTWQVDTKLFTDDTWIGEEPGQIAIVDRFLREVLGWEAYVLNPHEGMARGGMYDVNYDQRWLRCAPGRTNPLYPPGPESGWFERCAPTLDDRRYESVSLDLAQLDRQASNGIWVVNRWSLTAPFAQADPVAVEAQATERLEQFLAARIAGTGAEGLVLVDAEADVLLYASTSGARYERYEIELVEGPRWPNGDMTFSARLFADDDATIVEQELSWRPEEGLWLHASATTENGQPVALAYTSTDGQVTVSAASPWRMWWPEQSHVLDVDVWFGLMERDSFESDTSIGFVDPVAYDAWCEANGGSPLLSAPADAAAIAQQVIADPNFETTAPVAARVGGFEAVSIDVALAPGGRACGIGRIVISRWIHAVGWDSGLRLRLYLVDLPEGMSVETMAITVVAPEERFEDIVAEAAPIIESIEFHP